MEVSFEWILVVVSSQFGLYGVIFLVGMTSKSDTLSRSEMDQLDLVYSWSWVEENPNVIWSYVLLTKESTNLFLSLRSIVIHHLRFPISQESNLPRGKKWPSSIPFEERGKKPCTNHVSTREIQKRRCSSHGTASPKVDPSNHGNVPHLHLATMGNFYCYWVLIFWLIFFTKGRRTLVGIGCQFF